MSDPSGWQPIETAPRDGSRFPVAHELDPSSMKPSKYLGWTTGGWLVDKERWACSNGFICTDGRFRFDPTHWMPTQDASDAG